jgi:hypothetical protein
MRPRWQMRGHRPRTAGESQLTPLGTDKQATSVFARSAPRPVKAKGGVEAKKPCRAMMRACTVKSLGSPAFDTRGYGDRVSSSSFVLRNVIEAPKIARAKAERRTGAARS